MRANSGGFFAGGDHPLIQRTGDAAPLGCVFDHHEAHETAPGRQPRPHGILQREHAVEHEGHILIFAELDHGEHALALHRCDHFLGQGEDPRLAGDAKQAMGRLAVEPPRPVQAAIVDRAIEAMPGQ